MGSCRTGMSNLQNNGSCRIREFSWLSPILQAISTARIAQAQIGDQQSVFREIQDFPQTFDQLLTFLLGQLASEHRVLQRLTSSLKCLVDFSQSLGFANVVADEVDVFHGEGFQCSVFGVQKGWIW